MDFLDELRIEDLNAEQRELADTLGGLDIYINFIRKFGGSNVYVVLPETLTTEIRKSTYGKSSTAATTRNLHASTVYRK